MIKFPFSRIYLGNASLGILKILQQQAGLTVEYSLNTVSLLDTAGILRSTCRNAPNTTVKTGLSHQTLRAKPQPRSAAKSSSPAKSLGGIALGSRWWAITGGFISVASLFFDFTNGPISTFTITAWPNRT
ncbi:hypothetical protein O9992_20180 [Vibrio lentus]|nr:hypothetical protein [Vibrio lentus]